MSHFRRSLAFVGLLAFMVTASAQTPPSLSFVAGRDFLVGQDPRAIATGDFNGDGKLDLVTLNYGSNDVSVLLGIGDGTFEPAVNYSVTPNLLSLVIVGDFNGDGKLDIFVASQSTTAIAIASVSVLLGNGDGTFQPQQITSIANSDCRCLAVGDFNGDGKLDLAIPVTVPQLNNSAMAVMLGNSDGTFQPPTTGNPGPFATPFQFEAADMNGDGKMDLVSSSSQGVSVFLGNGDGTFQAPLQTAGGGQNLAIADFNGDGEPDVAFAGVYTLTVLLGKGDGTFQAPINTNFEVIGGLPLVPGDFNGDGKVDLFFPGGTDNSTTVLLGNGDGTFQLLPVSSYVPWVNATTGDFGGDGKLDVAAVWELSRSPFTGLVSIVRGNGDGTLQVAPSISLDHPRISFPGPTIAGDFNGDGKADLVQPAWGYLNGGASFVTLLGDGGGIFQTPLVTGFSFATGNCDNLSCFVATGDFKRDGKLDIAVSVTNVLSGPNVVGVLLGNGDGTFQPEVDYGGGNGSSGDSGSGIAVGDFNGDGNLDIVTADGGAGTVTVLLGDGKGAFGFPTSFPAGGATSSVAVADFNHDGNLDLAVTCCAGVAVLLGKGDGTFGTAVQYSTNGGTAVAIGDLNNDGNLDIVTDGVSVLLGNGDGTFKTATNYSVGLSANSISLGDLNGDGHLDVAALIPGMDVAILLGNGDGTLQPAVFFGVAGTGGTAIADFTGDGTLDVAAGGQIFISLLLHKPVGPAVTFSPGALSFGNQDVGTTSTPQNLTLTNLGYASLKISSIVISGDFAQTNTCGSNVKARASCAITVTFVPSRSGSQNAVLKVTDDAPGSPQTISLAGTGVSLGLTVSGSASATVTAGQKATYQLSIGGDGFSGTTTLTCTGAPKGADCTVPATVDVSATLASPFPVTVTTTARTTAAVVRNSFARLSWFWALALIGIVMLPSALRRGPWGAALLPCMPLVLLLFIASCGGGGGSSGPGANPSGTPAGKYALTVKATSGSLVESLPLALIVQ
jgi:hypothetical protein